MGWMQLAVLAVVSAAPPPQWSTIPGSVMQYYVSLPEQWSPGKRWPVVVVIESANKEFEQTASLFAQERDSMPFIIVTPMVVTNGGARALLAPTYRYSASDWAAIKSKANCEFDLAGIAAAVADVGKRYGGDEKYFLSGWEAGGHTVFAVLFRHPEQLRGAAPVTPNYQGRCVEPAQFSTSSARVDLPVRIFEAGASELSAPGHPIHEQARTATKTAEEHGYRHVSIVRLPAEPHNPMARQVLDYFFSIWGQSAR
jgi:hypothetical protein